VSSGSRFCGLVYSTDFLFNFTIQRNPLYYMIYNVKYLFLNLKHCIHNLIFSFKIYPCLTLNVITLITYFLPYNLQAGLCNELYYIHLKYLKLIE